MYSLTVSMGPTVPLTMYINVMSLYKYSASQARPIAIPPFITFLFSLLVLYILGQK